MPTVHMLIGIPGSGKTTFGRKLQKELNIPIISTDATRNLHPTWKEDKIWPEVYRLCAELLSSKQDFIFDATNITPEVRKTFRERVKPTGVDYDIAAYYIKADWHECYKRITIRNTIPGERYFPLDLVEDYGRRLIPPSEDEGFIFIKEIDE